MASLFFQPMTLLRLQHPLVPLLPLLPWTHLLLTLLTPAILPQKLKSLLPPLQMLPQVLLHPQ